eukprot:scaffold59941_cov46-Cyclotella_meneghiniana.AAC.4
MKGLYEESTTNDGMCGKWRFQLVSLLHYHVSFECNRMSNESHQLINPPMDQDTVRRTTSRGRC